MLPSDYRSYDSSGNNSINNTTRWVSKLMKTSEFYNDYQHFYISGTTTTTSEECFMYEIPPTHMYNWQWSSNPSDFQPENGVYQCHKELRQVTPTKLYCQSTELPVDWLVYYDAVSRLCRSPT